jgi:hypothetical protein
VRVGPYHAARYRMKVRDAVRPNLHRRNTCETAIQVHICRVIERKDLEIGGLNFSPMMVSVGCKLRDWIYVLQSRALNSANNYAGTL